MCSDTPLLTTTTINNVSGRQHQSFVSGVGRGFKIIGLPQCFTHVQKGGLYPQSPMNQSKLHKTLSAFIWVAELSVLSTSHGTLSMGRLGPLSSVHHIRPKDISCNTGARRPCDLGETGSTGQRSPSSLWFADARSFGVRVRDLKGPKAPRKYTACTRLPGDMEANRG